MPNCISIVVVTLVGLGFPRLCSGVPEGQQTEIRRPNVAGYLPAPADRTSPSKRIPGGVVPSSTMFQELPSGMCDSYLRCVDALLIPVQGGTRPCAGIPWPDAASPWRGPLPRDSFLRPFLGLWSGTSDNGGCLMLQVQEVHYNTVVLMLGARPSALDKTEGLARPAAAASVLYFRAEPSTKSLAWEAPNAAVQYKVHLEKATLIFEVFHPATNRQRRVLLSRVE
jgi:hypothetical protein